MDLNLKKKIFIIIFSSITIISILVILFSQKPFGFKVGYLEISGPIVKGSDIDIDKVIYCLDKFGNDNSIHAIVLKIDSPGGSVNEVFKIIRELNKINKTKIAYIDSVGASGAYLIASQTDYIISEPYSIIGSIGVDFSYFEIKGLLDKLGIKYVSIYKGKYKEMSSPYRNLTQEEKEIIENIVNKIYNDIVNLVKSKRNVSDYVFTSRFFLGKEGLKYGLIDKIGGWEDVKEYISKKFNVSKENIVFVECNVKRKKNFFEKIFESSIKEVLINLLMNKVLLT